MVVKYYNQNAEEVGELDLDENIFGLAWNADLVRQTILSMRSNQRAGTAHAKDRSEVRGGGKKPWRQKGTGRARHGSTRSPIWVGGGVTHGPTKEKNYKKKINKKARKKALFVGFSQKLRDNEILFFDEINLNNIKTKRAMEIINKVRDKIEGFRKFGDKGGKALICVDDNNKNSILSFRNLAFAEVKEARNLNILDLLSNKYIALTKKSVSGLEDKSPTFLRNKNKSAAESRNTKKVMDKLENKIEK